MDQIPALWFFTLSLVVGSTRYFREGCFKTTSLSQNPSQVLFQIKGWFLMDGNLWHTLPSTLPSTITYVKVQPIQWSPEKKTVDVCVSPLPGSTRLIYVYIEFGVSVCFTNIFYKHRMTEVRWQRLTDVSAGSLSTMGEHQYQGAKK